MKPVGASNSVFGAYMAGRAKGLRMMWMHIAREAKYPDVARNAVSTARQYNRDQLNYLKWVSP